MALFSCHYFTKFNNFFLSFPLMKKNILTLIAILGLAAIRVSGQSFYDLNVIQRIEIHFNQTNWDYQLDTSKNGSEGYILAQWVRINGVQFDSVGVKYKGNSSYNSNQVKNPFHIKLDYVRDNQAYEGFTDVKLSNGFSDPSQIREALAYRILGNYMACPRANFAQVYVNNSYIGLYTNDEDISKDFCETHFYSSDGVFVKCNPVFGAGPGNMGKSNLRYISADSSQYFTRYEIKSDYGWTDLVQLCNTVTNNAANLAQSMDIDRAIWMLAFNNLTVNLDSYSGTFVQNYYLYKDQTGHYNTVIWDLNMCFAAFTQTGSGGLGTSQQKQQMSATLHINDADWPLIKAILNNASYRKMYFAHMRTMNAEMFASGQYQSWAAQMQATIDTAVQSDTHKLFSYAQFQNGMTQDASGGMGGSIIAIGNLMQGRSAYLAGTADFQYAQPVITDIATAPSAPQLGETVSFTAKVTGANASSVFLGYRNALTEKFTRIPMYDDGQHADGAAGDEVFGASVVLASSQMQYYLYAENTNAGMFSPQRAEYEFYTLNAAVVTANPGDIVVNEFLAINQTDTLDDEAQHEDWIELYNTTSQPISLHGLYLSDDTGNATKWEFPETAVIPGLGFVVVWADNDSTNLGYHAGFKLSGNGESLLISYANGTVLDSLSFGAQTADVSWSRCPDGTGAFQATSKTTPGYSNDCTTDTYAAGETTVPVLLFPNPASEYLTVLSNREEEQIFELYDLNGRLVLRERVGRAPMEVPVADLPAGLLIYRISAADYSGAQTGRVVIQR